MAMYLNVFITYLSSINCNFVMSFDYYDNFPERMINLNNKFEIKKILLFRKKLEKHYAL